MTRREGAARAVPGARSTARGVFARAGRLVAAFGAFAWDFVVGDDWVGALGVAALLGIAAVLAHAGDVRAWWLLPPGVGVVLAVMLRRAVRGARATARVPRA